MEAVKAIKTRCLANPEQYLWTNKTKNIEQVKNIFYHIRSLEYADKPDYFKIRQQLIGIYECRQPIYYQPSLEQLPNYHYQQQM